MQIGNHPGGVEFEVLNFEPFPLPVLTVLNVSHLSVVGNGFLVKLFSDGWVTSLLTPLLVFMVFIAVAGLYKKIYIPEKEPLTQNEIVLASIGA